jgi:hypothetical protein
MLKSVVPFHTSVTECVSKDNLNGGELKVIDPFSSNLVLSSSGYSGETSHTSRDAHILRLDKDFNSSSTLELISTNPIL